ncbi:MAG: DNA helicase RecQ [Tunicatimonas sp.]
MKTEVKKKPVDVLRENFGYQNFRFEQQQIIERVLSKKDALVLMPTGGGKSLCYQIPSLMLSGLTLVVSPLISLMKDQVDALRVNGIAAAYLNSSMDPNEQTQVAQSLRNQEIKLLYVAPERLIGSENRFLTFLKEVNVSLLAIDEAHCISQWGHDFRPEYSMLSEVRQALAVPTIALTATADPLTQKDILARLQLNDPKVFVSSFNRANITYRVSPKRGSYNKLLDFLATRRDESGIIYVLSRASTEDLAERLNHDGYQAVPYHAKLSAETKEQHQEQFLRDEVKIVVATVAFGMGINKSNVRYVVHMDVPKNIEGYYQETGRAGRDGLPSDAMLFYSYADIMKLQSFVEVDGNEAQSAIMRRKLQEMATYGELRTCRRKYLLNYFGEEASDACDSCDVCQTDYQKFDGTVIAQKALSAVARLEERFGVSYVIDFLRGSKSEKIWDQHKQLKTYGVGDDLSKKDWRRYLDDLLHLGYLRKDNGQFPVLKLTERSGAVLRGEEPVMLIESVSEREETTTTSQQPLEEELLNQLKARRLQLARDENVPAYVIFSDATLHELATYLPLQEEDLPRISGFGEVKIGKYGSAFLKVIRRYAEMHGQETRIGNARRARSRTTRSVQRVSDTKQASYDLFEKGKSVEEVAQARGFTTNTIYGHLMPYVADGKIEAEQLVAADRIEQIKKAVAVHGQSSLKTIKMAIDESISYDEIRVVLTAGRVEQ